MTTTVNDIRIASVLDGIEEDRKYAAQNNKTSRVKIERGHAWLVRFLPFPMGKRGLPWARLAQHWIGGKPCFCKQYTAPEFGGDPAFECPICQVADSMYNQAEDAKERDDFYSVQARVHFMMYCVVIAKESDRGVREDSTLEELLVPYEFNIPKSSFALLAQKIERSRTRKGGDPDQGLLHLELGQDIWCARDRKNSLSFELSEDGPAPIFELNDQFDVNVSRLWKAMKQPNVKFLDNSRLDAIADKVAERAFDAGADEIGGGRDSRGGGRGGSRQSRENDDEPQGRYSRRGSRQDQPQDEPEVSRPSRAPARTATSTRASAPTRGVRTAQAALEEAEQTTAPADDDSNPELMPVPAQEPQDQAQEQEPQDQAQEESPAPPVRRAPATAARPVTPPAVQAGRRQASQASQRTAPSARAAQNESATGQVDDDPEQLAEEQNDPAPPNRAAMPQRTQPVPTHSEGTQSAPSANRFSAVLGKKIQGLRDRQQ